MSDKFQPIIRTTVKGADIYEIIIQENYNIIEIHKNPYIQNSSIVMGLSDAEKVINAAKKLIKQYKKVK